MSVRRCLFCAATPIETRTMGRFVTAHCPWCDTNFSVEFNPPDAPHVRARIERVDVDDDEGSGGLVLDASILGHFALATMQRQLRETGSTMSKRGVGGTQTPVDR